MALSAVSSLCSSSTTSDLKSCALLSLDGQENQQQFRHRGGNARVVRSLRVVRSHLSLSPVAGGNPGQPDGDHGPPKSESRHAHWRAERIPFLLEGETPLASWSKSCGTAMALPEHRSTKSHSGVVEACLIAAINKVAVSSS